MIFKIINFVIFLGVLFYFLRKPLRKFWDQRHKTIGETVIAAKNAYDIATNEKEKWNGRFKNIESEIAKLMEDLKREGEIERQKIVEQAIRYANQLKRDARFLAEHESAMAVAEIKKFAVESAIVLVLQRLSKETAPKEHLKIAENAAKEISAAL